MKGFWQKLLQPPRFEDPDEARVAQLVQAIGVTMLIATAAMSVNHLSVGQSFAAVSMALATMVSAGVLTLLRLRQLRVSAVLIPALFLIFLTLNLVDSYGLHDIAMVGLPAVIVLAGVLVGQRALFGYAAVTIAAVAGIFVFETRGLVPEAFADATDVSDLITIAVLLVITTILLQLLVGNLYDSLRQSRQARKEQQRLITELETKNAELERFAYTVSHDLKTPLVTINNFVGYLVDSAERGDLDRLRRDADRISGAARTMGQLLNDLLELARIGFVIRPPFRVLFSELVSEALSRTASVMEHSGVELRIEPDLPAVHGDPERLIEVLQNLLENAVTFMGEQPRPRIEIGARQGDGLPVFYVRDNGIGIEPGYHETVFDLFHRLNPAGEGTGLGLALAKRIIEAHRGRIWVESRGAGTGTTVCFSLPPEEVA